MNLLMSILRGQLYTRGSTKVYSQDRGVISFIEETLTGGAVV